MSHFAPGAWSTNGTRCVAAESDGIASFGASVAGSGDGGSMEGLVVARSSIGETGFAAGFVRMFVPKYAPIAMSIAAIDTDKGRDFFIRTV